MENNRLSVDREVLEAARKQFCLDVGLDHTVYENDPDKKCFICKTKYAPGTSFPAAEGARRYAGGDSFFKAIICMGQLFLAADELIYDWAVEKFADCEPQWFCEYGNLRMIDEKLKQYGRKIQDTHVYFLPAVRKPELKELSLDVSWYDEEEILQFKEKNYFGSAICFSPTQPDMLAVAAWKEDADRILQNACVNLQDAMAGMAGVSADGEYLWQIGINVIPEYSKRGLAVSLVSMLREEILNRGKIPFYGTSESHTISQTVGLKAGFAPAWTEIYVKGME